MIAILTLLFSTKLLAHGDESHAINLYSWNTEWHLWAGLVAMAGLYIYGQKKRGPSPQKSLQIKLFVIGMLALILALISPLDAYSEVLASIHMVQHTLILMVAAPLLALSAPDHIGLFATRAVNKSPRLRPFYRWAVKLSRFKRPIGIWLLYAVTLYIWHIPYLYEAALKSPYVHDLQHILFFGTSFLFWRLLLGPYAKNLNAAVAPLYLFVSMVHAIALGALMTLSGSPWYDKYKVTAPNYGLSALVDQQIAGLIMWMPAGIGFIIVSLYFVRKLLSPR